VSNNADWVSPVSSAWPRDGVLRYNIIARPEAANGWTGRTQTGAWCIKMPNPYYFLCDRTETYRRTPDTAYSDGWRLTGVDSRYVYHGSDGVVGHNYAVGFYGTKFQLFKKSRIGYDTAATYFYVAMHRSPSGGAGGGARLRGYLHQLTSYTGAAPGFYWEYISWYIVWDQMWWTPVDLDWWPELKEGRMNGIAFGSYLNTEYMMLYRDGQGGTIDGYGMWTARVNHDG
jgi:hypothetical protein